MVGWYWKLAKPISFRDDLLKNSEGEMKVSELIKKLEKLLKKHGDIYVVVDLDKDGYYNLEKVKMSRTDDAGDTGKGLVCNLISSNEA